MPKVNLSGMSVEALMDLRKRVDETLLERRAVIQKQLEDAWLAIAELYDYLEACHRDGLLECPYTSVERALKDLEEARDRLDPVGECDFELDLPADDPKIIAAEKACAERLASL